MGDVRAKARPGRLARGPAAAAGVAIRPPWPPKIVKRGILRLAQRPDAALAMVAVSHAARLALHRRPPRNRRDGGHRPGEIVSPGGCHIGVDSGRGQDRTLWGKASVESAMDGWSGNWEELSGLADRILARGVHASQFPLLSVRQFWLLVSQFSPGAGDGHALAVAHTAEISFELGEGVRQRKRAGLTVEPELLAQISPLLGGSIFCSPANTGGQNAHTNLSLRFCPLPESPRGSRWRCNRPFSPLRPNGEVARPPPYRQGLSLWVSHSFAGEPPPGNCSSGKGRFALGLADSQDGLQGRVHVNAHALVDAQAGRAEAGETSSRRFPGPDGRCFPTFRLPEGPGKSAFNRAETGLNPSIPSI